MKDDFRSINYPYDSLLRLKQVLKIIPVSRSTWWAGVKSGRFPKPCKVSPRCTVWRASDIREFIEEITYKKRGDDENE